MPRKPKWKSRKHRGLAYGYRSGFEKTISDYLKKVKKKLGFKWGYEKIKLKFIQPEKNRTYTPDFIIERSDGSRIFIETKGRFTSADRQKHIWVRECNPGIEIKFLFGRDQPISKDSKTFYSTWCTKNGFDFAISKNEVPKEWLQING